MSNHIHLVARQLDGKLNNTIRDLKAHTARKILQLIESDTGEMGLLRGIAPQHISHSVQPSDCFVEY